MNSKLKEAFDKSLCEAIGSRGESSFYIRYEWFDDDTAVSMMQDIIEMMERCKKSGCDCQMINEGSKFPKVCITYIGV